MKSSEFYIIFCYIIVYEWTHQGDTQYETAGRDASFAISKYLFWYWMTLIITNNLYILIRQTASRDGRRETEDGKCVSGCHLQTPVSNCVTLWEQTISQTVYYVHIYDWDENATSAVRLNDNDQGSNNQNIFAERQYRFIFIHESHTLPVTMWMRSS